MSAQGQRPLALVCGCGRQYRVAKSGAVPARCPDCARERQRAQVAARHDRLRAEGVRTWPTQVGPDPAVETARCGCGRDYATVPLEESHRCPAPLP